MRITADDFFCDVSNDSRSTETRGRSYIVSVRRDILKSGSRGWGQGPSEGPAKRLNELLNRAPYPFERTRSGSTAWRSVHSAFVDGFTCRANADVAIAALRKVNQDERADSRRQSADGLAFRPPSQAVTMFMHIHNGSGLHALALRMMGALLSEEKAVDTIKHALHAALVSSATKRSRQGVLMVDFSRSDLASELSGLLPRVDQGPQASAIIDPLLHSFIDYVRSSKAVRIEIGTLSVDADGKFSVMLGNAFDAQALQSENIHVLAA